METLMLSGRPGSPFPYGNPSTWVTGGLTGAVALALRCLVIILHMETAALFQALTRAYFPQVLHLVTLFPQAYVPVSFPLLIVHVPGP